MGEIDVTKVTAIEYLEKLIEIDKNTNCYDYNDDCYECEYRSVSCASLQNIAEMGVENHIEKVMSFTIFESELEPNWFKVEKDTLIEVRHREKSHWLRRYFAEYKNGVVYCYNDGSTSKTYSVKAPWEYARLLEDDND